MRYLTCTRRSQQQQLNSWLILTNSSNVDDEWPRWWLVEILQTCSTFYQEKEVKSLCMLAGGCSLAAFSASTSGSSLGGGCCHSHTLGYGWLVYTTEQQWSGLCIPGWLITIFVDVDVVDDDGWSAPKRAVQCTNSWFCRLRSSQESCYSQ